MHFSRAVDLLIAAGEAGDAAGGNEGAHRGLQGATRPWWEVADYMDVLDSHKASLSDTGVNAEVGLKNGREVVEHKDDEEEEDGEGEGGEGDEEEESWAADFIPEHLGEGIQGKYSLALVCATATATAATNSNSSSSGRSSWSSGIPATTATSYYYCCYYSSRAGCMNTTNTLPSGDTFASNQRMHALARISSAARRDHTGLDTQNQSLPFLGSSLSSLVRV